jgi:hypothetical protein
LLSERDIEIVTASENGEQYAEIGERHRLTPQGVGVVVNKARQHIDQIELELLRSEKTGDYPTLVIPYGDGYTMGQAYIEWVRSRLDAREVEYRILTRQVRPTRKSVGGTVFQFEPVSHRHDEEYA